MLWDTYIFILLEMSCPLIVCLSVGSFFSPPGDEVRGVVDFPSVFKKLF